MSDAIITPAGRMSFVTLWEPRGSKSKPDDKKYSVAVLFPPDADLKELEKIAADAAKSKWGTDLPKKLASPILDAYQVSEDADKGPYAGYNKGWKLIRVSTKLKPGCVGADGKTVLGEDNFNRLFYSGAWGRFQINAYAYDKEGNRGVSFGLLNVQFLKHDEKLGGRPDPERVFDAVEGADSGADTDSIFD